MLRLHVEVSGLKPPGKVQRGVSMLVQLGGLVMAQEMILESTT